MRVAYTLEQCWHQVPGGTAVAALELARALAERSDVELVGVAARHRDLAARAVATLDCRFASPAPAVRPLRVVALPAATPRGAGDGSGRRHPRHGNRDAAADGPVVVTVHDLAYLDYPELFTRQGLRFFHRALDLALREAAVVLCSSLATLERCRVAGFEIDRLRHVPLGVRARRATAEDVGRVRREYELPGRFVLWSGTVEPRKNLGGLLSAFALVETDAELVLVGPPGWNEDVDRLLAELPGEVRTRIRRLGWVPGHDLEALYAAAAVMCFPSLLEGFGFPVVEAMTQGTPVVTSRGTSTEELVSDGAGLLVDPRQPADIANALGQVLDDPVLAAKLGEAGQRRASDYTWARTADLVASAYRDARGA